VDSNAYFATELSQLDEFRSDGLIESTENGFTVTPIGRHFVRNIAMVFDAYLTKLTEKATTKKPIFSRTV
jgi:oxygen-independent coproporphyrinogen-3 oxidase